MVKGAPPIQVFRPTYEQFKDFPKYIEHMESENAHEAGVAKVIPPTEWVARKQGYDDINMEIPAPICQAFSGYAGVYEITSSQRDRMSVRDYRALAESQNCRTLINCDDDEVERKYWKHITYSPPIYGAGVRGTLTDPEVKEWNISKLDSILQSVLKDDHRTIKGINTSFLYYGIWKTTFAWHTEDMDLYSINYLHFGAPKTCWNLNQNLFLSERGVPKGEEFTEFLSPSSALSTISRSESLHDVG